MHVSKTIRKIKFSNVSYVKILRKSLRKKTRTCECSLNDLLRAIILSKFDVFLNQLKKKRHKEKTSYRTVERAKIVVQGD